jgi:hypothetical protein
MLLVGGRADYVHFKDIGTRGLIEVYTPGYQLEILIDEI